MKTLIVFSSKHGTTEKCANLIMKELKGTVDIINLKNQISKDISSYNNIIIGGSIHVGRLQDEVKKFAKENEEVLKDKNIGIFICCKDEEDKAIEYMKYNLSELIVEKAIVKEHLGHEINLEKMNFLEKALLKNIFKIKESYSKIDYDAIKRIANKINMEG
jgi:menaquinone-dependent protoporphyrinogen oxidase